MYLRWVHPIRVRVGGRHGDYREQRDGEHGHCRPIAGAAEVQHWDVVSNVI
jgi:hypothetical protein